VGWRDGASFTILRHGWKLRSQRGLYPIQTLTAHILETLCRPPLSLTGLFHATSS
jgi:hypothetical protein